MKKYRLEVWCRRNDVSREAGLHAEEDFPDDESALLGMRRIAEKELLCSYDEVGCKVMDGERLVGRFSLRAQAPQAVIGNSMTPCTFDSE